MEELNLLPKRNEIWLPDLYFPNAISKRTSLTEELIFVAYDGNITRSWRVHLYN